VNTGTLVLGALNGLVISLLAVGFVLVYKANRFLNLASAQLGVLSALLVLKAVNDWGWNWWLTFVACVLVGVATGLVVERFVVAVAGPALDPDDRSEPSAAGTHLHPRSGPGLASPLPTAI
jgi:branched-subunit amino acid ABC-type transport system permease component